MTEDPPRPAGAGSGRSGAVRPGSDVFSRRLNDETVIAHLGTNRIYTLNATGARLWELLEEGHDRETIEQKMCAEFDVTPRELAAEVERVLESLRAEGLVVAEENG